MSSSLMKVSCQFGSRRALFELPGYVNHILSRRMRPTVALESFGKKLIQHAYNFEILLCAGIQGIRSAQIQRFGLAVNDTH